MIEDFPIWIEVMFLVTCLATLVMFYYANAKSGILIALIVAWSALQSVLALQGFYQTADAMPPRLVFMLLPALAAIIFGLRPKQIKWMMEHRNSKVSTFLHTIRIPVEIVLLYLFLNGAIPELMTFEGRNFDIIVGITAPIVGLLLYKNKISAKALLLWNVAGLCLVCFILINGILSAEVPFQLFGFEQPNRAITYFPFILLPATIVPIVIYTHVTDIIKLRKEMRAAQDS